MKLRTALAAFVLSTSLNAASVTFRDMVDNQVANNEAGIGPKLAVVAGLGLTITTTGTFNVGCGTGNSCLGADAVDVDDFAGELTGVFASATPVLNVIIVNFSTTDLYDVNDNLITSFAGNFNYAGTAVKKFVFRSRFDAIHDIEFRDSRVVPEPATLVLAGAALGALTLLRRK